jgi:endonuclease/exonuclease/phosphatase family metal-dependent hydrolase
MGLVVATFNVLDLFDAGDPRIERLAALLRPHAPDVVALQEIGNASVAAAFSAALGGGHAQVVGTTDERGISNALVTRHPIVSAELLQTSSLPFPRFHRADPDPFEGRIPLRRAIPNVVVDAGPVGLVRFLVVHFKSRRARSMRDENDAVIEPTTTTEMAEGEARAVVWRCAEALFVRQTVDARLAHAPDEKLMVCGDFNDVSGSLPLRIVAGTTEPDRPDALVTLTDRIPVAERISVLHDGDAAGIDHALVSSALAARFERCFYDRTFLGDPGYSDHAPLIVRFR